MVSLVSADSSQLWKSEGPTTSGFNSSLNSSILSWEIMYTLKIFTYHQGPKFIFSPKSLPWDPYSHIQPPP